MATNRIKALDQKVVNRIAAGEVIVAPVNALKEMMENSIDAGSTSIEVVARDGGLKLLQITDNGHGIEKDDLNLLCKRFTTSKLQTFDDLKKISTYGFRGEALASISHISRISVVSKTENSQVAYKAQYLDGNMNEASLKPLAGKNGTKISVEDLFYNALARRRAFRSAADEYSKIVDVIGRYSIHCRNVAFFCKRYGEVHPSLAVQRDLSTIERVRNVYGSAVADELINIKSEEPDERLGLISFEGLLTNANYSSKKSIPPILFINHRLVSCDPLRRGLMEVYKTFLPKGGHPFIYLSLILEPSQVDVNVHPTKREVRFLHENEIVEKLCNELHAALNRVDTSRSYQVQTVLPASLTASTVPSSVPRKRVYPQNFVRTDPQQSKLHAVSIEQASQIEEEYNSSSQILEDEFDESTIGKQFVPTKLTSVKSLRAEIQQEVSNALNKMFENYTYVGVADYTRRLVAIQYDVKLILIDYGAVSQELFYQIGLADFGNFGSISFEDGNMSIRELLSIVVTEDEKNSGLIESIVKQLVSMNDMLTEYFGIVITDDGELASLPMLIKGYTPPLSKLPLFLYNLGVHVNWDNETECFRTLLTELSLFCVPDPLDEEDANESDLEQTAHIVEHIILPTCRSRLIATTDLLQYVVEIANLPGLYRVFERC